MLASVPPVRPPAITLFVWVESAKSVDEAGVDEVGDALALFGGIAGGVFVGLGASEIYSGVGGVEIAAGDDWFVLF